MKRAQQKLGITYKYKQDKSVSVIHIRVPLRKKIVTYFFQIHFKLPLKVLNPWQIQQIWRVLVVRNSIHSHCVKSVQIRSFSDLYFSVFVLNAEIYGNTDIFRVKYGKITTRKTPYLDTFDAVSGKISQLETFPKC